MESVEICAGLGGLALGVQAAGFSHRAVIEVDATACSTIRRNMNGGLDYCKGWPLHEADVGTIDFAGLGSKISLLSGGVPCQPFSGAGKRLGHKDPRNLFPQMLRAQRELLPRAVIVENVRGLSFASSRPYLDYLTRALAKPTVSPVKERPWTAHDAKLRQARAGSDEEAYNVRFAVLNAADYGVPQWRERVLIVAVRKDQGGPWEPPVPTHSVERLVWDQYKTDAYWKRHGIKRRPVANPSHRVAAALRRIKNKDIKPQKLPWVTVRDATGHLAPAQPGVRSRADSMHYVQPGALAYYGHSGSLRDEPSKTLKAGAHGVPGGENTLALRGGKVRYYSLREAALIQTLPESYHVEGPWAKQMRQIGNAVPVRLAQAVADSVRRQLAA